MYCRLRYVASLAIWDHTVLSTTRHNWAHPRPYRPVQYSIYLPRRDGRPSWPMDDLLHTEMVYPSSVD